MQLSDRYVDVRVDDHPRPIEELKRIFRIYDMTLLSREDPEDRVVIQGDIAKRLQDMLAKLGYYKGEATGEFDERTRGALERFMHLNNLENKIRKESIISGRVYRYLQELSETT